MRNSHVAGIVAAVALLLASSCAKSTPRSVEDARRVAEEQLAQAQQARRAGDERAAKKAATAALAAEKEARTLVKKLPKPAEADTRACRAASDAARETVFIAKATREELLLRKKLDSLTCRTYRKATDAAVAGTLLGLEEAARYTARNQDSTNQVPAAIVQVARVGADLVNQMVAMAQAISGTNAPAAGTNRNAIADADVDWLAVAGQLKELRSAPPEEFRVVVALGLALGGIAGPALYEIERVDRAKLRSPDVVQGYLFVRALAYYRNDMSALAIELLASEVDAAGMLGFTNSAGKAGRMEQMAAVRVFTCMLCLKEGRYVQADRELAALVQLMPEDTFVKVLQQERMRAEAPDNDAVMPGRTNGFADCAWLAALAEEHVKNVRDQPFEHDRLVTDPEFVTKVVMGFIGEGAKRSEAMARINGMLATARSFAGQMMSRLPFQGTADGTNTMSSK